MLQASQQDLGRTSSSVLLSKQRTAVNAADSDSDPAPTSRSLLRIRASSASQTSRQPPMVSAVPHKPAQAASSDSDDELVHLARSKQAQLPSSKQAAQSSRATSTNKATAREGNRSSAPVLPHSKKQPAGATLPSALERRISRDSTTGMPAAKGLLTQVSLQKAAISSEKLVNKRKATAQVTPAIVKAADITDADSDEEQWNNVSVRAARSKQVQVTISGPIVDNTRNDSCWTCYTYFMLDKTSWAC